MLRNIERILEEHLYNSYSIKEKYNRGPEDVLK